MKTLLIILAVVAVIAILVHFIARKLAKLFSELHYEFDDEDLF